MVICALTGTGPGSEILGPASTVASDEAWGVMQSPSDPSSACFPCEAYPNSVRIQNLQESEELGVQTHPLLDSYPPHTY